MKALLIVTGRGMGGDAVIALNTAKSLEKIGISCEFALDFKAPGILFEKNNINWHKIDIPQSGGHAATKKSMFIGGLKLFKASFKAVSLIKKIKPDIIVGIIGGGAVVGSISAKIARVPSISIVNTPVDSKISSKLNSVIALTESPLYSHKINSNLVEENSNANNNTNTINNGNTNINTNAHNKNNNNINENDNKDNNDKLNNSKKSNMVFNSFYPLNSKVLLGDKEKALDNLPNRFDKNKKTVLFSSGSSLFPLMAKGCYEFSKFCKDNSIDLNILVVGYPLEEKYNECLNQENIINLSYIDWIKDLYDLVDLAILTDDGVMVQEAIACKLPIIALNRVKYGRYHNIEAIFKGAVVESDFEDLNNIIIKQLDNLDEMKVNVSKYSKEVLNASSKIANIIQTQIKH
ncbi:MAG: glycosyltransferase [Methanobrevibacter sp.]|jgi:UDP-N-acetylglucosamine--N-acetylmuramyl-(pentapeptide) pyrophosphoryl-undecaprenol N-acetylglucosamine transferase|nr:glycosyltransferase [Candidatus Methanoflexus mossambicus]